MFFPTLQLTPAGQALLVKVIGDGKVLTFSRMAIGDGTAPGTTGLTHQAINIPINYYTLGTGAASMTGTIDNSSLQSGVNARELGVFAIDPDNETEIMYAYAFNGENPAYIPPASSSSYERIALTVVVAIGSAQNVTVILDPFIGYATTEDFNAHKSSTNPHPNAQQFQLKHGSLSMEEEGISNGTVVNNCTVQYGRVVHLYLEIALNLGYNHSTDSYCGFGKLSGIDLPTSGVIYFDGALGAEGDYRFGDRCSCYLTAGGELGVYLPAGQRTGSLFINTAFIVTDQQWPSF